MKVKDDFGDNVQVARSGQKVSLVTVFKVVALEPRTSDFLFTPKKARKLALALLAAAEKAEAHR